MKIMISEPDGRLSGLVIGETIGVNYELYFKFRDLNGKTGEESISVLEKALNSLSMDIENDYEVLIRERMQGVLSNLLELAKKNPGGIWKVS